MDKSDILKVVKDVKGILPGDHPHRLIDAVMMAPHGPYMEIGALYGASTCCIALAVDDGEIVMSIDPFKTEYLSSMAKKVVEEIIPGLTQHESFFGAWEKQVMSVAGHKAIHPVVGDRLEVLDKVKSLLHGSKAGFLFIDGLHTYEAVRDELIHYLPLMAEGAIVAFHDYSSYWGLYGAVNEAIKDGRLEVITDHYLLVTKVHHG